MSNFPAIFMNAISALLCLYFGLLVLHRNPGKPTHRAFAILSGNLMLWAIGVLSIVASQTVDVARFWLIFTFCVSAFLPATFYYFIALFPGNRFQGARWGLTVLYASGIVCCIGAVTPWHIASVTVEPGSPPTATYGPVFLLLSANIGLVTVLAFFNLISKIRNASGIERRQVHVVMLGIFVSMLLAIGTNIIAPIFNVASLQPYGPAFSVVMMAMFAYAMVRYHLLNIWAIFSRTTVYAAVTACVMLIFWACVSFIHWFMTDGSEVSPLLTTLVASLVIAIVLQPVKERIQLVADRVLINRHYDVSDLLARVSDRATSIGNRDEMLRAASEDLRKTIGPETVRILLCDQAHPGALVVEFSTTPEEQGTISHDHEPILEFFREFPQPLLLDVLLHAKPTRRNRRFAELLQRLDARVCVPLKTKTGLQGLLALGPKVSRDIYTPSDIVALKAVAAPLATAIENAALYGKLQEAYLHRDLILTNMRGGVLAVDTDRKINAVNRSALDIVGLVEIGDEMRRLPAEVRTLLEVTLVERRSVRDFETLVTSPSGSRVHVAMSSSCLLAPDREIIGAMVMIYDLTQVKRLEQHVQRAEQLSSIGTLAAGMAHEIKNPLVSIKTMTQLLLSRYNDPDFRATFTEIVPHEVERIDSIVSSLLDFARPRQASFALHDVRDIFRKVVAMLENQLLKNSIIVRMDFPDECLRVFGDEQQLHQVFLNLVLNSVDSMQHSSRRELEIKGVVDSVQLNRMDVSPLLDVDCMRISLSDTGCGIPEEIVKHLFTPFFTTKPHGSGLGLSVAHGIIKEHGGIIDVRSRPGEGTTFEVTLPIISDAEPAREYSL